jgi:hypothetical protein
MIFRNIFLVIFIAVSCAQSNYGNAAQQAHNRDRVRMTSDRAADYVIKWTKGTKPAHTYWDSIWLVGADLGRAGSNETVRKAAM